MLANGDGTRRSSAAPRRTTIRMEKAQADVSVEFEKSIPFFLGIKKTELP